MVVILNVGGVRFYASIDVLRNNPGPNDRSIFANMNFVEGEEVSIDRDGTHFGCILDYLRDGRVGCRSDERSLAQIKREAQYYGLEDLVHHICVFEAFMRGPILVIRSDYN